MPLYELTTGSILEGPTWFGDDRHPLLGWLTQPTSGPNRGSVVIAPPIGYEARNAKAALRKLAKELSLEGITTLRFDYRGTGDSSGTFDSTLATPDWIDDINCAVEFLRASGFEQVSIVAMRLGATLAAQAIADLSTRVRALVLWDPCESGRSYLRETGALEALRKDDAVVNADGAVETAEYLFESRMVTALKSLNLRVLGSIETDTRFLLVLRDTRPLSTVVQSLFERLDADVIRTVEQEACFDVLPFNAKIPRNTIKEITRWISKLSMPESQTIHLKERARTTLEVGSGDLISERAEFVGPYRNFALLTEPVSRRTGPLVVFLQNVHEDHNGPSRMWVDLARELALAGARSVRIDLSGLGETRRGKDLPPAQFLDEMWTREVVSVCQALEPSDPSNTVFVGLCSAATLAIEASWRLNARGLCVINPPLGTNVLHQISKWQDSRIAVGRRWGQWLSRRYRTHPWIVVTLWELARVVRPPKWRKDFIARTKSRGTNVLVLSSNDELTQFDEVPFVRKLDGRHHGVVRPYPFEVVPDLDHGLTVAAGRRRAAQRIIQHLGESFFEKHGSAIPRA